MSSLSIIHGFHVFPNSHHYHFSTLTTTPIVNLKFSFNSSSPARKSVLFCAKKDNKPSDGVSDGDSDPPFDPLSVEKPPYYSYMDSTSGQLEPASGARASIPGQDYWPEGTASRVRAARAPKPSGKSTGEPSFGKNPGSRRGRKKHLAALEGGENASELAVIEDSEVDEIDEVEVVEEELSNEFVVYQDGLKEEVMSDYEFNKRRGNPHPFIDPSVKREIKEPLTSEELWWNWKKPEKEQWSRWQRRRPDSETVS